jgi:hypothetical protein
LDHLKEELLAVDSAIEDIVALKFALPSLISYHETQVEKLQVNAEKRSRILGDVRTMSFIKRNQHS